MVCCQAVLLACTWQCRNVTASRAVTCSAVSEAVIYSHHVDRCPLTVVAATLPKAGSPHRTFLLCCRVGACRMAPELFPSVPGAMSGIQQRREAEDRVTEKVRQVLVCAAHANCRPLSTTLDMAVALPLYMCCSVASQSCSWALMPW